MQQEEVQAQLAGWPNGKASDYEMASEQRCSSVGNQEILVRAPGWSISFCRFLARMRKLPFLATFLLRRQSRLITLAV